MQASPVNLAPPVSASPRASHAQNVMTPIPLNWAMQRPPALLAFRMVCGFALIGLLAACGGGGATNAPAAGASGATVLAQPSQAPPVTPPAAAPGFYIDALLGKDANPGTVDLPWQSLARARTVTLQTGQGIYLRCGRVWRESMTLGASQLVDGSQIAGYGDECATQKAVISGADDFSGGWTLTDGVWSRSLPAGTAKITQLLVEGQPLRTAQWPNADTNSVRMALVETADNKRNLTLRSSDAAALQMGDLVGATIQIRTQAWMIETRRVTAVNRLSLALDNATNWDLVAGQGYVLQDKRWMLDSAGEYFHDEAAQRLFVIAPTAQIQGNLNTVSVEGSVRDIALRIGQRAGIVVQQLSLTGARDTGLLMTDAPGAQLLRIDASKNVLIGIQLRYTLSDGASATGTTITNSTVNGNASHLAIVTTKPIRRSRPRKNVVTLPSPLPDSGLNKLPGRQAANRGFMPGRGYESAVSFDIPHPGTAKSC